MSKETWVIILGIAIAVMPYLGFPSSWKTVLFVLLGLTLVLIGFLLRTETLSRSGGAYAPTVHQPFVENSHVPVADANHDRKEGITSLN